MMMHVLLLYLSTLALYAVVFLLLIYQYTLFLSPQTKFLLLCSLFLIYNFYKLCLLLLYQKLTEPGQVCNVLLPTEISNICLF